MRASLCASGAVSVLSLSTDTDCGLQKACRLDGALDASSSCVPERTAT